MKATQREEVTMSEASKPLPPTRDKRLPPRELTRAVVAGLVLVLFAAPFPLGANRTWAWSVLAVAVAALVFSLGALLALRRAGPTVSVAQHSAVTVPAFIVFLWAVFQMVWPLSNAPAGATWSLAAPIVPGPAVISIDPMLSSAALIRWAMYGAVFFLSMHLAGRRGVPDLLFATIVAAGTIAAVFAVLNHAVTGSLRIFAYSRIVEPWVLRQGGGGSYIGMSGPFVYANAYAAYALLAAIAGLFLLHRRVKRSPLDWSTPVAARLIGRNGRHLSLLLAIVLLLATLMWSGSRGGLLVAVSILAVTLAGFILLARRLRLIIAIFPIIMLLGTLAMSVGDRLTQRLTTHDSSLESRWQLVDQTISLIRQAPHTGWGLGTFSRIYAFVRQPDQLLQFNQAHSTIVELIADLGVPATILLVLPFVVMSYKFVKCMLQDGRNAVFGLLGLTLLVYALAWSVLDFTMQMPSIALTWMSLLGIAFRRCLAQERM